MVWLSSRSLKGSTSPPAVTRLTVYRRPQVCRSKKQPPKADPCRKPFPKRAARKDFMFFDSDDFPSERDDFRNFVKEQVAITYTLQGLKTLTFDRVKCESVNCICTGCSPRCTHVPQAIRTERFPRYPPAGSPNLRKHSVPHSFLAYFYLTFILL